MKTATKGNAGEAAVLADLVDLGLDVLVPFGGGHPYDLVVDLGDAFLRVQCKTAWHRNGCILFNSRSTGGGPRFYLGLADIFGVYFPPGRAVFLVPVAELPGFEGRLRLERARINQRKGIRIAADYSIDQWTAEKLRGICREAHVDLLT